MCFLYDAAFAIINMKIHILGIGGTFMAGIAIIAKQLGHDVSGSDKNLYDPMKSVLINNKIRFTENYNSSVIKKNIDLVIVGNVMTRGIKVIEELLSKRIKFCSGPEWLYNNVLINKKVIAVSGTHGKTTTSSLITSILKFSKLNPSYLIGGMPIGFDAPAKYTKSDYFVIEADEYDTSFFDKRSKFMHYRPWIFVINNIEFDHADIFDDTESIIRSFHHVVRTIPNNGTIVYNKDDKNIKKLLKKGIWSKKISFSINKKSSADWILSEKQNYFLSCGSKKYEINSPLIGLHNYKNISLALIAAKISGIPLNQSLKAIEKFKGVKRRMEFVGKINEMEIYDDFAHHPTEVESSIMSLKKKFKGKKVLAICEIKSNSMISGIHKNNLIKALNKAHQSILVKSHMYKWSINNNPKIKVIESYSKIHDYIKSNRIKFDIVLIMSNKSTKSLRDEFQK